MKVFGLGNINSFDKRIDIQDKMMDNDKSFDKYSYEKIEKHLDKLFDKYPYKKIEKTDTSKLRLNQTESNMLSLELLAGIYDTYMSDDQIRETFIKTDFYKILSDNMNLRDKIDMNEFNGGMKPINPHLQKTGIEPKPTITVQLKLNNPQQPLNIFDFDSYTIEYNNSNKLTHTTTNMVRIPDIMIEDLSQFITENIPELINQHKAVNITNYFVHFYLCIIANAYKLYIDNVDVDIIFDEKMKDDALNSFKKYIRDNLRTFTNKIIDITIYVFKQLKCKDIIIAHQLFNLYQNRIILLRFWKDKCANNVFGNFNGDCELNTLAFVDGLMNNYNLYAEFLLNIENYSKYEDYNIIKYLNVFHQNMQTINKNLNVINNYLNHPYYHLYKKRIKDVIEGITTDPDPVVAQFVKIIEEKEKNKQELIKTNILIKQLEKDNAKMISKDELDQLEKEMSENLIMILKSNINYKIDFVADFLTEQISNGNKITQKYEIRDIPNPVFDSQYLKCCRTRAYTDDFKNGHSVLYIELVNKHIKFILDLNSFNIYPIINPQFTKLNVDHDVLQFLDPKYKINDIRNIIEIRYNKGIDNSIKLLEEYVKIPNKTLSEIKLYRVMNRIFIMTHTMGNLKYDDLFNALYVDFVNWAEPIKAEKTIIEISTAIDISVVFSGNLDITFNISPYKHRHFQVTIKATHPRSEIIKNCLHSIGILKDGTKLEMSDIITGKKSQHMKVFYKELYRTLLSYLNEIIDGVPIRMFINNSTLTLTSKFNGGGNVNVDENVNKNVDENVNKYIIIILIGLIIAIIVLIVIKYGKNKNKTENYKSKSKLR